ncbi:MAG: GHKL domain-containing protein [Ignavibacteriales bacterium]|nr:GHKL domain-containing protein [Ignavibacteriales bacterium]
MVKASADSGQHSEEITLPGEVEDRIILVSLSKIKTVYNTSGFMFVGLDITKQKKLERELAHSEKLAALGKMSTVLAHEIKTPLTSIKLNIEMLLESLVLSQEDNSSFRIIQKEINRMNGLVNDVLQLSRVYVLNYSSVMMNRFTENIIEEVRNKVQQKSLQVKNMVKTVELEIDSDKMRQVLLNMIDNAIEASDENGIIELISEVNEERNKFSLKIKNGCTEMPDIGKIFVPFYTNKVSGTGLGLSISRNIVEQHYGEIILSLAQENQIEFTIILPILRS